MDMEGEYFVFEHYTSNDLSSSCLVPLRVVDGCLEEISEVMVIDPEEIGFDDSRSNLMEFLKKEGVAKVWSCGGHYMYDEVLGFTTHYSGGEGEYAYHYDSIIEDRVLEGVEVEEFVNTEKLSEEERERRRLKYC